IFFIGYSINRWEGLLFLGYYAAYNLYLYLNATHHDALGPFNLVMMTFVIPITVVTLLVLSYRFWRHTQKENYPVS
ncbi:MAG: sodium:calcium antiporter, partial [Chloroflexi bacterium]